MSNSLKTKKSSLKDGIVISINKQEDDVMKKFCIDRVWTDDTFLWIETKDGRSVCIPFSKWKRLENATKAQRDDFILGYTGIHWPSLDEDLGYEGLFVDAGLCETTPEECSVVCEP